MMLTHDPQSFVSGDNWQLTGPLLDVSGNPINLAGATLQWKLDSVDGFENVLLLDSASRGGITITDLPSATVLVDVTAAQSAAVSAGTYRDWLRITFTNGTVYTAWAGVIRVSAKPS
jgi:hypothetical protein